jgi:hypothetical protein
MLLPVTIRSIIMSTQNQATAVKNPARVYSNVVLTVIAGLLSVIALDARRPDSALVQSASAQSAGDPETGGLVSAADQRKQIIAELRTVSGRLEKIESVLRGEIKVKVTEMPESKSAPGSDRK